jgi:hypothetical protein
MFILDGKPLALDRAFTHDGVQYPSTWLRLASPEDRAAIGIEEQPEPPVWDQRFYWGYDQDGQLIPKQLNDEPVADENGDPVLDISGQQVITTGLKTQWKREQKSIAGSLLAASDWYVVREAETGVATPTDVIAYRQAVRDASNAREAEIEATTTVEELCELLFGPSTITTIDPETGEQLITPNPSAATPWPAQG